MYGARKRTRDDRRGQQKERMALEFEGVNTLDASLAERDMHGVAPERPPTTSTITGTRIDLETRERTATAVPPSPEIPLCIHVEV